METSNTKTLKRLYKRILCRICPRPAMSRKSLRIPIKHRIGDKCFFVREGKIVQSKIDRIDVFIGEHETIIRYGVDRLTVYSDWYKEDEIITTKKRLIKKHMDSLIDGE